MSSAMEDYKTKIGTTIKAITDRYQPLLADLEARGKKLGDDFEKPDNWEAVLGVDFDIEWKDNEIIFDLPSVTMRTQDISLDLPEVTMVDNTIVFETPSVRMVTKKVGQYPEIHGWTIEWKDILTEVPETFMQEQRIVFGLPSVTMRRQDWKIDIPEFRMEQQRWVVKLPSITIKNVRVETQKVEDAGKQLAAEGKALGDRMKVEISTATSFGGAIAQQDGIAVQSEVAKSFDTAIASIAQTIQELVAKGIDPIKVPGDQGDVNLRKQLAELIEKRDAAVAQALSPAPTGTTVPVEPAVTAPAVAAVPAEPAVALG